MDAGGAVSQTGEDPQLLELLQGWQALAGDLGSQQRPAGREHVTRFT
jgi:hypothetical protein